VQEARPYLSCNEQHEAYQKEWLFAADALLLGRKTYEAFSAAYPGMAKAEEALFFVSEGSNLESVLRSASSILENANVSSTSNMVLGKCD
jgi:hypothetical protein